MHIIHLQCMVTIILFTTNGPLPGQKITLRCKKCNINYRYDTYGDEEGFKYYNCIRDFIAASNVCYIERNLCESWVSACMVCEYCLHIYIVKFIRYFSHRGWVSFECSAEIYNETIRETKNFNHEKFWKFGQNNKTNEDGVYHNYMCQFSIIFNLTHYNFINDIYIKQLYVIAIDEDKTHNTAGDIQRKRVANAFWTYQNKRRNQGEQ